MASPALRTAPDPSATNPTSVLTTFHLIDASGDTYTEAFKTTDLPALADVQTLAGQYQAVTQASLFKISQSLEWEGDEDSDNADTLQRNSVKDGINLLYRNPSSIMTYSPRVVAPVPAILQGNQDIPLFTGGAFPALITGIPTIYVGYNLVSGQFTERRERSNNPKVKA